MKECLRRLDEDFRFAKGCVLDEALLGEDGSNPVLVGAANAGPSLLAQHFVAHQESSVKKVTTL